ncbi:hypothetical protein MOQ_004693 [Trypanosoma cruzi marinkellei]|uniref:Uncharacterized protein n=1 Tax=Trypanosoma cruzi marinkellei TaxID=85056 RepID=K2N0B7_TRYCR|nr:hypothetical protein MOQ_004693 [Trypanosoma cruzi marinkellei]
MLYMTPAFSVFVACNVCVWVAHASLLRCSSRFFTTILSKRTSWGKTRIEGKKKKTEGHSGMNVSEMEDLLLGKNVVRLPRQYDASSFLQMCSLHEQYRILASICRIESRNLLRRPGDDCSAHNGGLCVNAAELSEHHHGGIPEIYYSARLLAFMSDCGPEAGVLNILKKEHTRKQQQREKEEEEEARLSRELQAQEGKAVAEGEGCEAGEEGNEASNREVWYDEEGGYYYDSQGYYDADGYYYYFETADAGNEKEEELGQQEEEQNEEVTAGGNEDNNEVMPHNSQRDDELQGEAEWHNTNNDGMEESSLGYCRVVPDESQLALSPFLRGVCTLNRAIKLMEQSTAPVDVYMKENDMLPSFPVLVVSDSAVAGGKGVYVRPECIHVLASSQHLHIVYVPTSPSNGQEKQLGDEKEEKMDGLAPLLDLSTPVGVLMSIPLNDWGGNCTTHCGSLGNGRVFFEIHVAMENNNGMTLSMVFGIPPDASFWSAPLASRLVECYEQRVLHHLAKSECVLDELLLEELGNASIGFSCALDTSRPLFSYSALLLSEDADSTHSNTDGNNTMHGLVYNEANNSVLFGNEREESEQKEQRLEFLYRARDMEPPQWRFLREALSKVQQDECKDRDKLTAEAWKPYQTNHQLSFHTMAFEILPLLRTQEASVKKLIETEQSHWEGIIQRFSKRHQWLFAEETRRRLEQQFAFERRTRLLQCSVDLDILIERETAMRAMAERDEVLERHSGELMECWITLLTRRRTDEICRTTPVKDDEGMISAARNAEETDEEMEGRLGRPASRSRESQQPLRASSHSIQSPTTGEFMRMVSVSHRGTLAPCRTQPLRQICLPPA